MYLKTIDMKALVEWTLEVGNRGTGALVNGVTDGFDPNRGSDQDDHQGRSPMMRHVSRTFRVALDLFVRQNQLGTRDSNQKC